MGVQAKEDIDRGSKGEKVTEKEARGKGKRKSLTGFESMVRASQLAFLLWDE